jgi:hypothetical protein
VSTRVFDGRNALGLHHLTEVCSFVSLGHTGPAPGILAVVGGDRGSMVAKFHLDPDDIAAVHAMFGAWLEEHAKESPLGVTVDPEREAP